jgi:glycosyltransferase involved in cell wall biosynthesis
MRDHLLDLAGTRARQLRFMGNLPPERLYPTLRQADVVVLPSLWENFALSALESLTLARPLVATRSGGFAEMIADDENGVLVPPADAAALSRALVGLLGDDQRRARLGAAGAVRAERFGKERVTAEHVAYFEQIANGRV